MIDEKKRSNILFWSFTKYTHNIVAAKQIILLHLKNKKNIREKKTIDIQSADGIFRDIALWKEKSKKNLFVH